MFSPSWRKVRVMAFLPSLALPLLRLLPAETAHRLTIAALSAGFAPKSAPADDPRLASTLWGLRFPNPIGMAAGFDKNGEAYAALLRYGFGFTEIGTVTPLPQAGNPKPRLFRLRADQAIINRMGFNNDGLKIVAARLAGRNSGQGVVGGNLGKNRETLDPIDDYRRGVASLGPFVDYLVVNVSSPNTPGLRDLQRRSEATALIEAVLARRDELGMNTVPVLLKVAPDLSEPEVEEIAGVTLATKIDGLIVSNTTTSRPPSLRSRFAVEPGGLSGQPLFEQSTALLRRLFALTKGSKPIIGVGGIASGRQAYAKIRAGASLVQLYSGFAYHGPALVTSIKRDLLACLDRDGFATIQEAIGSDHAAQVSDVHRA